MRVVWLVLVCAPLAWAQPSGSLPTDSLRLVPRTFEAALPVALDYLLYMPDGYEADVDQRWPLVLFLHGSGERGRDLRLVTVHGPPKHVAQGQDFPFILVAPQLPRPRPRWEARELSALLDRIEALYRVDTTRVYVTGLSMGGYGTWDLAILSPQRFAAIAPVCGGGLLWRAPLLKDLPIWAFHGAQDDIVPLYESERMVEAVNAAGGDATLTVYPDAGHDVWTETYANPAFYTWLLSHRRPE